jgi:hypothetical protein
MTTSVPGPTSVPGCSDAATGIPWPNAMVLAPQLRSSGADTLAA